MSRLSEPVTDRLRLFIRRQIKGSKQCAIATTQLYFRVLSDFKGHHVDDLLERVHSIGLKLISAQPKELVIGNIVRRILGLIREAVAEFKTKAPAPAPMDQAAPHPQPVSLPAPAARPLLTSLGTSFAPSQDVLFGIFSDPAASTPPGTPATATFPKFTAGCRLHAEIKVDVFEGLREILAEINLASEQISELALSYVNGGDVLLVPGGAGARTALEFLAAAAHKRRFTVFVVEGAPNEDAAARAALLGRDAAAARARPADDPDSDSDSDDEDEDGRSLPALAARRVTPVLIPSSAVRAVMPYVNKVLLAPHAVLANGGLVAAAGAASIAAAAGACQVPVLVLSAVYRLSPVQPVERGAPAGLCEAGSAAVAAAAAVRGEERGGAEGSWQGVDVENPLWDYVEPSMVNLYITNL
jgi:translation initiation factor eIF-2B subunit beta